MRYAKSLGYKSIEFALYDQYQKVSYKTISDQAHINPKAIRRFLVTMGLKIGKGGQRKADIDPKELVVYLETHLAREAAEKYGVCIMTIWRVKNKYLAETPCRICGEPREPENYRSGNCNACRSELGGEENRCTVELF